MNETRVVVLDGVRPAPQNVGGKGASLARLIAAGLPVPPTAAVTTAAFRAFVQDPSIRSLIVRIDRGDPISGSEVDAAFLAAELDEDLATEIAGAAALIGEGAPLAVRSSATVEDAAAASFAGQYRTVLDVDSNDSAAVGRAIRLVWASMWHPAPTAYRRAIGMDDRHAAMAVVLMAMVPARRAGVVFTRDPGGRLGHARVEAVAGPGSALVSGAETPDAWVLSRTGPTDPAPFEVAEALRLSVAAEELDSQPQDVEWAFDGDRVWLVQARPITGTIEREDGFDTALDDHELTTAGIAEMIPGVLPPLRWQMNFLLFEEALRRLLVDLDVDMEPGAGSPPLIRRVRGRAALDFDQLRMIADALPGGVAEELETQYFGLGAGPAMKRVRHGLRGAIHDLRVSATRRRAVEDSAVVVAAVDRMQSAWPDLADAPSSDLLRYERRLIDLAGRGAAAELTVAAAGAASYRRLETLLERHLGPAEAGRQAQLLTTAAGITGRLDVDSSASVFGGMTWRELGRDPPSFDLAADTRDTARLELERLLTSLPHWRTTRLLTGQVIDVRIHLIRRSIRDTIDLLRLRERTKSAVMALGGEVRRVLLELGHRLAADGLLTSPEDIELLTQSELRRAAMGDAADPRRLARRAACNRRYEAMGPLPMRFVGRPGSLTSGLPDGDHHHGWAASPGRYTGPARVVARPEDSIRPGDVLVAIATDASWSPLFVDAGAIVVERGGPLSHAAILARELGIPAVLNLAGATRALADREVTVDGDVGTVVVSSRSGDDSGIEAAR